jgi:hypothetical protein
MCKVTRAAEILFFPTLLLVIGQARADTVSPLFARGYNVVPEPQKVELEGGDFEFGSGWRVVLAEGVNADDVAVESLKEGLESRFSLKLEPGGRGKVIELAIRRGSVEIGKAADRNKAALAEQAYELDLGSERIRITANAPTGLFYGVETLEQLVKSARGKLWLPEGRITDWPDLEERDILWEDLFHVERPDVLKAALRQAAFYKINGFVIKLDGHFQYRSAPALIDPYALSPAQLQELTAYGLRYRIQLIPYLDGPAHIPWILKHPEYAKLREFPDSNYELCVTNPDSYKLLEGMYQDLLDANEGVKDFFLSTDEPYFVGMADNNQCQEKQRAKELGSRGKLLAEFVTETAGYLHDKGRNVIIWGEFPLIPTDIPSLPRYLISGELYGKAFDDAFKARGIRQYIFTSNIEWKQFLFPDYYIPPSSEILPGPADGAYQPAPPGPGRVAELFNFVSNNPERSLADICGTVICGWDTQGTHMETMWLGYVAGSAVGWHPGGGNPQELMASFYNLFYGPGAINMGRLYQWMSEQAEFWKDSWELVTSSARKGTWGDYPDIIYQPRLPAEDQTLPLPAVPSPDLLKRDGRWSAENARRLELASVFYSQNAALIDLLNTNLQCVRFNQYNLEVYVSIAGLYRQNLEMLMGLQHIDSLLDSAERAAAKADAGQAVAAVDQALDTAKEIRKQRNEVLHDAIETWYESWFPRVAEANGRRYLLEVDDVKDYLPYRTADMSYLVYRELLLPLGRWYDQVEAARNQYAKSYSLPDRTDKLNWEDYQSSTD